MANTDLQLNTTITLKDEFSSQMGGFASSVGRLHGMLESLNTTMNKITHIASTPLNNNFSNGLASIGRSAHRANIELTTLNSTLTRTVGLVSHIPSGAITATAGASAGAVGSTRGLLGGIRGLFGGITRGIENVFSGISRKFSSLFSRSNSPLNPSNSDNNLPNLNGFSDLLKNNLVTALVGAFGSAAVLNQAKKLFEDATKQMTVHQRLNHLDYVANGDINIKDLKDKIFGASMRSKTNYLDFADMVANIGATANEAFGSDGELIQFTEQLQKIFTTDNMGASERASATVQLSRALANGQFEGRQLNSILSPTLINLIAKTLEKPRTEIKKLASEGKISADIVKKAVFDNVDEINKKFLDMPDGWGEVMIRINNYAQHAFQGVYQKITDIFSADRIQRLGEKIAPIFYNLASILEKVIDGLTVAIDWALKNIDSLLNAFVELGGVVTVLGTILGLVTAINLVIASGPIGWALAIFAILEGITVLLNSIYGTSHSLFSYLLYGLVFIGEHIINAFKFTCFAITWVIGLLVKLVARIFNFLGKIYNALVWTFKNAWILIKSIFLNGINSLFQGINSLAKGIVNILLDVINSFLNPLEKGLNAIIGLTNKVSGSKFGEVHLRLDKNGALQFIDTDYWKNKNIKDNQSLINEAQKSDKEWFKSDFNSKNSLQIFDQIVNLGADSILNNMNNPAEKAKDALYTGDGLLSGINNLLTKPNSKSMLNWDKLGTGFDKSSVLNDIKKNTDDIRNNSDFSKYLRELADRNSINHFTSPTYSINLENQNTINSQADYNGFVTRIVDEIKEALLNSPQSIPYGGAYA